MTTTAFQKTIWNYYKKHKRPMRWRSDTRPYYILVSEIMLQQTQVERVIKLFPKFIKRFPSLRTLAHAPRHDVILAWQGLGYNRRAIYLHTAAQAIMKEYKGIVPRGVDALKKLSGIGPNTAASISAFAFDMPVIFVETNIRSVFLFHFFRDKENIHDSEILELVRKTLPKKCIREWYWALMDYGTYLKREHGNQNKRSRHYTKQKKFEGSNRQLRGKIIKLLIRNNHVKKTHRKIRP